MFGIDWLCYGHENVIFEIAANIYLTALATIGEVLVILLINWTVLKPFLLFVPVVLWLYYAPTFSDTDGWTQQNCP